MYSGRISISKIQKNYRNPNEKLFNSFGHRVSIGKEE